MGTNGEYLENPRRQSILKRLLDEQTHWQHWVCRSSCGAGLPAGFLRFSQDRSLKSEISKSTDTSENLGSLYIPVIV